jgi:hypothetical protein
VFQRVRDIRGRAGPVSAAGMAKARAVARGLAGLVAIAGLSGGRIAVLSRDMALPFGADAVAFAGVPVLARRASTGAAATGGAAAAGGARRAGTKPIAYRQD